MATKSMRRKILHAPVQISPFFLLCVGQSTANPGLRSYCHYHLSDLLVGFQVLIRLNDVLEAEGLGNSGLKVTIFDPVVDVLLGPAESLRIKDNLRKPGLHTRSSSSATRSGPRPNIPPTSLAP